MRPELEAQAEALGLSEMVTFTGRVEHQDLPPYYAICDVYVTASLSDTNSISMLEGMCSGLPVLQRTDPLNAGQVVDGENGFNFNTPREMADKLRRIRSMDPEVLAGFKRSVIESIRHSGARDLANHTLAVYQKVLAADKGKTACEIKSILEKEALDATIYIAVDTLEYLKKGGRITPAAAALGTVLKLKPVLTIQGDKLDSYAKARGMKSAFRIMLDALKADIASRFSHLREQGLLKVGIANTLMPADKLEEFKSEMRKNFPDMELVYFPLTMSIGTHVGPGGIGIGAVKGQ